MFSNKMYLSGMQYDDKTSKMMFVFFCQICHRIICLKEISKKSFHVCKANN